ncbi:hypothetical protein Trco_003968 [Trichoderma cornu-damae]|uniref:Aminoglycoside phosphotransferase domain-containing protein n=1 Tax=Trichoderma cornu-damae TaxID=654480 RepID=A0A9P8QJT2_9HYPO|nr:hypothetical protein Trco_003968 [Trichoderma cornu-damae]
MFPEAQHRVFMLQNRKLWRRAAAELYAYYAMSVTGERFSNEAGIAKFFEKTSAARSACDARARELVGGSVVPVRIQDDGSYSVYAGPDLEYVVQFRLKSLHVKTKTTTLARTIYGSLVPEVSFQGQLGGEMDGKEPLSVYLMSRIRGITHLDYILAHGSPENSQDNFTWRKNLMADVARFFAISWKTPQKVDSAYRDRLGQEYSQKLQLLLTALPDRFHPHIQGCIRSMGAILSLPMVLTHREFGYRNLIVNEASCRLVGVVDWAEAEVCPFGLNLKSLECLTGKLLLRDGWKRYEDHADLHRVFWDTFKQEVGGLTEDSKTGYQAGKDHGLTAF